MAQNFHRLTVTPADRYQPGTFRTVKTPSGARFIVGRQKGDTKTSLQAALVPATWSHERARDWSDSQRLHGTWEWANPTGSHLQRLGADALRRAYRYLVDAEAALLRGDRSSTIQLTAAARSAVEHAAAGFKVQLTTNPETYTTASTHIREAIVHLLQADKETNAGALTAARDAIDAAREHLMAAVEKIEADDVPAARPNNCQQPERNPPKGASTKPPPAINPEAVITNPAGTDVQRTALLREAARRGLHAATWQHPKHGTIVSVARLPAPLEKFQEVMRAIVKAERGRGLRFYPAKARRRNPPAKPAANPPPPRSLVVLGDFLEVRMANGQTKKWKRGELAMLAPSGAEKESAGRGRLLGANIKAAKPVKAGTKTSERTFETWHGELPRGTRQGDVPGPDEFNKSEGKVKAIVYYSAKWRDRANYIHDFDAAAQPTLYAGPHGSFEIRGGKFRVTARGIVH